MSSDSSNKAIGWAVIIIGAILYFFGKIISVILVAACLLWLVYEKFFNKSDENDASTAQTLTIASGILCAIVFGFSWIFSVSPCDCYDEMSKQVWGEDYDYNTYQDCLDIYREEVVEGYEDLDCSSEMVKLYLTPGNWTVYFNDKCKGEI